MLAADDLLSGRPHWLRASTRIVKGSTAMNDQTKPTVSPEPAKEVSESNEAFMQLLMNVKFVELLDKLPPAPEHVITAYVVTDADGQPIESDDMNLGPVLVVAPDERTAWCLSSEPQQVRKVIMLVMPKGSEVSENGGEP